MRLLKFLFIGFLFGVIVIKAEIGSWFRIQEMFHFQSFHMYGIIGSAVIVGIISIFVIRKFKIKTVQGEDINIIKKPLQYKAHFLGGIVFGFGWALTGACPGPMYVLVGAGYYPIIVTLFFAIIGTGAYGLLKDKLPH